MAFLPRYPRVPGMICNLYKSFAITSILLLILCYHSSAVFAEGSIEGTVVDRDTGLPIAYCNVVIIGTGMGEMTNADGSYRIDGIPPGTYSIRIVIMGYETDERCRVDVRSGEVLDMSFELEPRDYAFNEVVIIDDRSRWACDIHRVAYQDYEWFKLPVVDTAMVFDDAYEKARLQLFPEGDLYILDECLSQSTDSSWAWRCPECLRQAKLWLGR
jgi:hypothetical protein